MKNLFTIFFSFLFFFSLNAQHLSKVYILSEGGFSQGTSMLSLYNVQSNIFYQSIFSPGNIGLYPDGLIYHNGFLYLTEQGSFGSSGKIYKLDTLGNVLNSAIVGTNPYSLAIANNKIYITNGPASNVSVLNLSNFSFIKNISVGVYPQEIIAFNNKIFVANNSLFGGSSDSTVSVIDPIVDSVIAKITVRKDPSSFAISNDGFLLIGCPGDENNGKIFKINPNNFQKVAEYSVPIYGVGKDISVDKNSNDLFLISYLNDIVKYNPNTNSSSLVLSSVYPNNYYYGYAYDFSTKKHFVLDAKNFTVNGSMRILDSTYNLIGTYQTGIAPRRILFKYFDNPSSADETMLVNNFILEQNYPNPFGNTKQSDNFVTKISWQSPISGWTTLKIYDVLGNELETVFDNYLDAGYHDVTYSAKSSMPSGIYFYSLSVTNGKKVFSSTKKMIVVK